MTQSDSQPTIFGDATALVGNTPIFRLARLSEEAGAELLVKAEHLNPGGSIKDRVALNMVLAAESSGALKPGQTLVEATAGNTGIGLAWIAAARGYKFVSVMNASDKGPKTEIMEAMGAEVALADPNIPWDTEEGCLGIAQRIADERGGIFLNQFENDANPQAHETTAAEIVDALGDSVDTVIVGVGTGGTATGLARGLRPRLPNVKLIGVSAEGSYLGSEKEGDRIAGITPDFEAAIFDPSCLDEIVTVEMGVAAEATRRLLKEEGLPVGHSSGALLKVAQDEARKRPGSRILFFLCDSVRNYAGLSGRA